MKAAKGIGSLFIFLFSFLKTNAQSPLTDSVFHTDSLRHIVEVLASDSLQGRFAGRIWTTGLLMGIDTPRRIRKAY